MVASRSLPLKEVRTTTERYLCDFIYSVTKKVEITELLCADVLEAYDWLGETYLEIHFEKSIEPCALRLRLEDEVLALWETHFDAIP